MLFLYINIYIYSHYQSSLLAFAVAAIKYSLVKPIMTESKENHGMEIYGGRHILYECCMDIFVKNDMVMGDNAEKRVMILTGPNSSGKSVYIFRT